MAEHLLALGLLAEGLPAGGCRELAAEKDLGPEIIAALQGQTLIVIFFRLEAEEEQRDDVGVFVVARAIQDAERPGERSLGPMGMGQAVFVVILQYELAHCFFVNFTRIL